MQARARVRLAGGVRNPMVRVAVALMAESPLPENGQSGEAVPPETPARVPPVPGVLRLAQRSVLGRWRATPDDLYREIAALVEAKAGREVLVSACGDGSTVEWLASRTGASVTGVDADNAAIEEAEQRIRLAAMEGDGMRLPVTFQHGSPDDLPHEDEVFDAAIGEPGIAAVEDPARSIAELARVVRPMGVVVLLQLTWSSDIPEEAREAVVERLGLRPHLLVEWKQMLRDAGLVDIQVQDWTRGPVQEDTEDALGWRDRMRIVGRAWKSSGWKAAREAVQQEEDLLRELSRERALGFQLLHGVKWPRDPEK